MTWPPTTASGPWLKAFCAVSLFSIAGLVLSHAFGVNPGSIPTLASILVLATGAAYIHTLIRSVRITLACSLVAIAAEGIGVRTGLPFGQYEYTGAWVPSIQLGTSTFPLLVPLAWLLIVGLSWQAAKLLSKGWQLVLLSGLIAALMDAPMEDIMVHVFHYWRWSHPGPIFGAPILNSAGWFAVSCLLTYMLELSPMARVDSAALLALAHYAGLMTVTSFLNGTRSWPLWLLYTLIACLVFVSLRNRAHIRDPLKRSEVNNARI
jgi:putative membrane protein